MFNYEFYDREKLYAEVWTEPITTVAAKYGVSDVALKKACKKLKVPTPGRGYWQKVKAGARIARPPLPRYDGPRVVQTGNPSEYEDYRQRHLGRHIALRIIIEAISYCESFGVYCESYRLLFTGRVPGRFCRFRAAHSKSRDRETPRKGAAALLRRKNFNRYFMMRLFLIASTVFGE
jgi:hypothetical protein